MEKKKLYLCAKCQNLVEGLWNGRPPLLCCGEPMTELEANTTEAAVEKHIPVIERDGDKVTVTVGSTVHPMSAEHYILFVEVIAGDKVYRQDFVEGDTNPSATFLIDPSETLTARAYCNLHGLWATE